MKKSLLNVNPKHIDSNEIEMHHKLKAHKIGDATLTVTTIVLVLVSLKFNMQFAPFIILLMSSRIGTSIYTLIKTASKKEFRKLVLWSALFLKSVVSCCQFFVVAV